MLRARYAKTVMCLVKWNVLDHLDLWNDLCHLDLWNVLCHLDLWNDLGRLDGLTDIPVDLGHREGQIDRVN